MKTLYKLTTKLGEYFVIADHPSEAINKLKEILDYGDGYGFSSERKVTQVNVIAEEITLWNETGAGKYYLTDRYLLT